MCWALPGDPLPGCAVYPCPPLSTPKMKDPQVEGLLSHPLSSDSAAQECGPESRLRLCRCGGCRGSPAVDSSWSTQSSGWTGGTVRGPGPTQGRVWSDSHPQLTPARPLCRQPGAPPKQGLQGPWSPAQAWESVAPGLHTPAQPHSPGTSPETNSSATPTPHGPPRSTHRFSEAWGWHSGEWRHQASGTVHTAVNGPATPMGPTHPQGPDYHPHSTTHSPQHSTSAQQHPSSHSWPQVGSPNHGDPMTLQARATAQPSMSHKMLLWASSPMTWGFFLQGS